jgi:hypothetical protein
MSDNKNIPAMPGFSAGISGDFKTGSQDNAVALEKDQPVSFTYPDGFNAAANSLQFLPEESRVQALAGFIIPIVHH